MSVHTSEEEISILVGDKVRLGKKYCEHNDITYTGEELEFILGEFENDNGLYCFTETAPSLKNEDIYNKDDWDYDIGEYESIYHLFGNNLDKILDCKIIKKVED